MSANKNPYVLSKDDQESVLNDTGFKKFFSDFGEISKYIDVAVYPPGALLINRIGDVGYLFYIFKGEAVVSPVQGYKKSILRFKANWFTGEIDLFMEKRSDTKVKASSDGECHCIRIKTTKESREILFKDADFLLEMCKHFSRKVLLETKAAIENQTNTAIKNLAKYILLENESSINGLIEINKVQLSKKLGVTREHVIDVTKGFTEGGMIEESRETKGNVKLYSVNEINRQKLVDISNGDKILGEFVLRYKSK
jgi:CRP-like cAMP-binding protein